MVSEFPPLPRDAAQGTNLWPVHTTFIGMDPDVQACFKSRTQCPCPCGSGKKHKRCHGAVWVPSITPVSTLESKHYFRISVKPRWKEFYRTTMAGLLVQYPSTAQRLESGTQSVAPVDLLRSRPQAETSPAVCSECDICHQTL